MTEIHQRDEPAADVATAQEVLETFTAIMRSSKTNEQMKAAENLAKHYGLLTPKEEGTLPRAEVVRTIEEVMQTLEAEHAADP